jgi:3D (Asp-Asp-Asp) domain-containing protein
MLGIILIAMILLSGCHQEENLVDNTVVLSSMPDEVIEEPPELEPPVVEEAETVEKITYRVTAYCACEKCCGKWALNRPLDENGEPIVYGAAGEVLVSGVSVASPLPFGTQIELDGYGTVVVQDRTAKWVVEEYGEDIIDIYFDSHEAAWNWGCQYIEGVIIE